MLAGTFGLTLRQQEVSALLLAGHTTASTSRTLGVKYNTARRHCEAILQQCGIRRREQLAILALENFRG
ncbi:MAG: LuxR C-terminal-related transcriptional regulator [Pseudomonadota bacterium]